LPQNKEIYLKIYVKKLKYINNNLFYLPSWLNNIIYIYITNWKYRYKVLRIAELL
jgi:hypothetical protein